MGRLRRCGLLGLVTAWAALACSGSEGPERDRSGLPEPVQLESMDLSVQAQYREAHDQLQHLLETPDPAPGELADAYGRLGMWGQIYGDRQLALDAYREARRLDPDDMRWAYYASLLLVREDAPDAAREGFQRVIALRPGFIPAQVRLAELELHQQRLDEAERGFTRALRRDPRNVRALLGLGRVALEKGDVATAVRHLEAARTLDKTSEGLAYSLGMAYRRLGELERAQRVLREVSGSRDEMTDPPLHDPLTARLARMRVGARAEGKRGYRAMQAGRTERGLEHLRNAVAARPERPGLRMSLAGALEQAGDVRGAMAEYREALRLDPGHVQAHVALGRLLEAEGPPGAGAEHFRAALERDPDHSDAHGQLGMLELRAGNAERAEHHLARAVESEPDRPALRVWRARALLAFEQWQAAARALEQDRAVLPGNGALRTLQARLLAAAPDPALRDGRRALALAREDLAESPPLYVAETIAMAHAELGERERAVAWQRAALAATRAAGVERMGWVARRLAAYEAGRPSRAPVVRGERLSRAVRVTPPAG